MVSLSLFLVFNGKGSSTSASNLKREAPSHIGSSLIRLLSAIKIGGL
jgi:hypothetical protein